MSFRLILNKHSYTKSEFDYIIKRPYTVRNTACEMPDAEVAVFPKYVGDYSWKFP